MAQQRTCERDIRVLAEELAQRFADVQRAASVGRYTYAYDDNLYLTQAQLESGGQSFTFDVDRDVDGLITGFGPFAWGRSGPGGAISQIADDTLLVAQGLRRPGPARR